MSVSAELLLRIASSTNFIERTANFAGTYMPWRASFSKIEAIAYAFDGAIKVTPVEEDSALLVGDTRFEEEGRNLFREVGGDRRIVFQEGSQGEITGYINDGFAVIQMYKAPFYRTSSFTLFLLIMSVFVFLAVLLRRAYQGATYKALPAAEKAAFRASLALAVSNLLFVLVLAITLATVSDLNYEVPGLLNIALIFPIIALLATFYHLYQSVVVWRNRIGSGIWSRIRFSVVTLCGLMMVWLYNYWNFIGFNYYA